jgi:hypothetical protein
LLLDVTEACGVLNGYGLHVHLLAAPLTVDVLALRYHRDVARGAGVFRYQARLGRSEMAAIDRPGAALG